jgi:hypothetical protein
MTIFGPSWAQLQLPDVEAFLQDAPSEPLEWEAKGDFDPNSIRRQVCGFANSHNGGYLILGAQRRGDSWTLDGVGFPNGDLPSDVRSRKSSRSIISALFVLILALAAPASAGAGRPVQLSVGQGKKWITQLYQGVAEQHPLEDEYRFRVGPCAKSDDGRSRAKSGRPGSRPGRRANRSKAWSWERATADAATATNPTLRATSRNTTNAI